MSRLIFFFLLLSPSLLRAECKKKIDPSKVILFVDTNWAGTEIATVEASACERGERLLVIPSDYKIHDQLVMDYRKADQIYGKCLKESSRKKIPYSACDAKEEARTKANDQMRSLNLDYRKLLRAELQKLKDSKSVVKSFIISGHDGGGLFGGDKGDFERDKVEEVFKDYPEVNKIESALLLGCYTGVRHEVKLWTSLFPELRLIGGYDASAPVSEKPEGLEYIKELLASEKTLLEKTDQKKLAKKINDHIKILNKISAGIYIKPYCVINSNVDAFYYGTDGKNKGLTEFLNGECKKPEVIKEIKDTEIQYKKYNTGELNPPSDTTNGELRKIYNKARRFEHCIDEGGYSISLNYVFNLLFFEGTKKSFSKLYKNDLDKADKIFKNQKNPSIKEVWVPTAENLNTKSRKEILDNIHKIHALASNKELPADLVNILSWMGSISNQHLVYFMNPFSWHAYTGKVEVPANYTPLKDNFIARY